MVVAAVAILAAEAGHRDRGCDRARGAGGREPPAAGGPAAGRGTGRHWSDGSYERAATDGEPAETLTIAGDRVPIGDRWAGTWEWSGWTVVIDNDPACPGSRGTYHARDAGEENIRFVKVVDTCAEAPRGGPRDGDLDSRPLGTLGTASARGRRRSAARKACRAALGRRAASVGCPIATIVRM